MFDGIKRRFASPSGQANALNVKGDVNAPVNLINLVLENGAQIEVPLDINWRNTQAQPDAAPSQLLHWRARLTDLFGRDDELAALKAWAQGGTGSSQAQVIVGDGGVGKTRLAMELADWLRVNQHWRAGALSLSAAGSFRAVGAIAGNTLIVVDYPEANPVAVKRLLRAVKESEANKSIKLLFLTREHESMSAVVRGAGAQDLFAPTPFTLTPFADAAYALFCAVFKAVALQSKSTPPNNATFDQWQKSSPLHAAALFIVAAGISAVRYPNAGGASDAIPIGVELLNRMCDDETRKLQDAARGVNANPDAAVDVLAVATLLGDINFDTLVALPEAQTCGIEDTQTLRSALLASGHATQDDATSVLTVARLEPDLFAAAFMHQWHQTQRNKGAKSQARLSDLVAQCFATSAFGARVTWLNQWNRLAFDSAVRLEQVPNHLDGWLCELLQTHSHLNRALTHAWSASLQWVGLPHSSAAHRDAVVDSIDDAERAMLLNNRAVDMAASGDRDGALTTAREAVERYRKLAPAHLSAYKPDLAMSLNNLARFQSETGDRQAALITAREAVGLYRKLAQGNPAVYTPDLARSLNTLGNRQSQTGDRKGALATDREAVELCRKLAQANSSAYTPDLAMSLNNLARSQRETGDREAALVTAREAVDLYRVLARTDPAAHTLDLATSLNNLAPFQSETGDREGGLATARQAVELLRKFAQANPAAYTWNLATCLNNLGVFQSQTGDGYGALAAAREAVELLRKLAQANPAAYTPDLAGSLDNLADAQSEPGDCEGALVTSREATELWRKLAQANPAAYSPDLARSLRVQAKACANAGRSSDGLAAAEEAMMLLEPFAASSPAAFGSLLQKATQLRDRLLA